jgi:hypothetical protein
VWHARAVSFPPGDVILAQLACPLNDVIFIFTYGITPHLSTNIAQNSMRHKLFYLTEPIKVNDRYSKHAIFKITHSFAKAEFPPAKLVSKIVGGTVT